VLKDNDHLQLGQVAQFIADMPKEAVEIMKAYEKETLALCEKKPVFYIIADKNDFKKSESRRDPILLARHSVISGRFSVHGTKKCSRSKTSDTSQK
jgi:hypothetical protein